MAKEVRPMSLCRSIVFAAAVLIAAPAEQACELIRYAVPQLDFEERGVD